MNQLQIEPAFVPPRTADIVDVILSILLNITVIVLFCISSPDLVHWFLIPVFLCGSIIGIDAIKWFRKKMDIYDPKGIMGIFGILYFLMDPLFAATINFEIPDAPTPPDYKLWIGKFFVWQAVGLVLYQIVQHISFKRPARVAKTYWTLDSGRAVVIFPLVISLALGSHLFFMIRMGGIGGFLEKATYGAVSDSMVGVGPLMVFGRSIPILILVALTLMQYQKLDRNGSLVKIGCVVLCMGLIILFFYGLDTSRSTLVWGMVWVIGIIHLFWRQIRIKWILVAILPFLGFMYVYGFYKNVGTRVFEVFSGQTSLKALEVETGRTFHTMLIGDLGRSEIQASMLYTLHGMEQDYRYRLGSTYLTSVVPLIPRQIWPSKPTDSGKVIAATELFFGKDSYRGRDERRSTRIFALAGEALLNYGVWGIPVAYAVFGYLTARVRRRILSYYPGDMRLLTAPFLTILLLLILTHDSSNVAMQALFNWVIPAVTIFFCAHKIQLPDNRYLENEPTGDFMGSLEDDVVN